MALSSAPAPAPPSPSPLRGAWSRLFGYDIFLSFALGPPPRGCRAYASDLARKLRDRGFTVFFSEDEAPAGGELDPVLKTALRRSRVLVVLVNPAILREPRWVRTEVETFRALNPGRPIVPINLGQALEHPDAARLSQGWLPFQGRIWIDDTEAAGQDGRVSDPVIDRLATAPHAVRSLVRLRVAVGLVVTGLALLAALAWAQRQLAVQERDRARQGLLATAAQQAMLLAREGRAHDGWLRLVEALATAQPAVDGPLPEDFLEAALTTLIEDRLGPALQFDPQAPAPPTPEPGDTTPVVHAFDAGGARLAVAAGTQVAVWSTGDGARLHQAALPLARITRLDFAAGGQLLVVQGLAAPAAAAGPSADRPAVRPATPGTAPTADEPALLLLNLANGEQARVPLATCWTVLPCIGDVDHPAKQLRPLAELPDAWPALRAGLWPVAQVYLADAAGPWQVVGQSAHRHVLLQRAATAGPEGEPDDPAWWLLDARSGRAAPLPIARLMAGDRPTSVALAAAAPVLALGAMNSPFLTVARLSSDGGVPRLTGVRRLRAPQADATAALWLSDDGRLLHYQNDRYGTGPGVGIGRSVVLELDAARERWARSEGAVVWGPRFVALQEDWDQTQLLAADTGATWFSVPGRPLGFDPAQRMLLLAEPDDPGAAGGGSDPAAGPAVAAPSWPRLRLLEVQALRRLARDSRGPASTRGACVDFVQQPFLALTERADRLWNRHDWHRLATPAEPLAARATADATGTTRAPPPPDSLPEHQGLGFVPDGPGHWQVRDEAADERPRPQRWSTEALRARYPVLSVPLAAARPFSATLSLSPGEAWQGAVWQPRDAPAGSDHPGATPSCSTRWALVRRDGQASARAGCVTGERAEPWHAPALWWLPATAPGDAALVVVPEDSCRLRVLAPDTGADRGTLTPAFGAVLGVERLSADLLAVTSADWYGSTTAWQLHALGDRRAGPLLVRAARVDPDADAAASGAARPVPRAPAVTLPPLLPADLVGAQALGAADSAGVVGVAGEGGEADLGVDVTFQPGGQALAFRAGPRQWTLGVPPWGERLRERLRAAVAARAAEAVAPARPPTSAPAPRASR